MRRQRQGGFTLLELMMTLVVLGIVGLVGGRLLVSIARVWREVPVQENIALAEERAAGQLREDAWGASSVTLSGATVTMGRSSGTIKWTFGPGDVLTRQGPAAGGATTYRLSHAAWVREGASVRVRMDRTEFALTSEINRLGPKEAK